ncbi:MAG TPA: FecR domain-containing protein [Tepidisphaeraceae bacterium]|nr:FecR domain-containing protein [Tepidisphaeraceae bacterium]
MQPTQPAATPSQPATQPAESAEALQATVTGVEGVVQVRTAEGQPWQKAAVGMVLDQNAEFRTGPRSAVQFTIPPDQTITLDRLGTVKVLQAVNDNGKFKTNLGMRYGRTRYDIEAAGREHESTISSPSSTLAVRGTKVSLYDQRPFVAQAVSLTGRAEFRDARKRIRFGGPGAGKLKVNENADSAAEASLAEAFVDPGAALARTDAEAGLIANLLSRGATIGYDYEKGIKVIRGGTHPTTDAELIPVLPGSLNFVLRWDNNADLNLAVLSPHAPNAQDADRNTVYPIGGLNVIPNGGRTGFDHRGGPNGGIEIVYWPGTFPEGGYFFGSQHISGATTPATVDVFQGGQRVVETVSFTSEAITPNGGGEGMLLGTARIFADSTSQAVPASVKSATKVQAAPAVTVKAAQPVKLKSAGVQPAADQKVRRTR